MVSLRSTAISLAALLVTGGAVAIAGDRGRDRDDGGKRGKERARATLVSTAGRELGRVDFRRSGKGTLVTVTARGLEPGYHGFHVHAVGSCDPDTSFKSAGGHFKRGSQTHGDHLGDLPALLADERGRARASSVTDRFTVRDLRDADGSAVIVHAGRDNLANIPERYDPNADQETLDTGDAGPRAACGVVR